MKRVLWSLLSACMFVLVVILGGCCHTENVIGNGSYPCETCDLRPIPVDLACGKSAEHLAEQDATAKAVKACGTNKLSAGAFHLVTPVKCVKRGSQWFVDATVSGEFKCCK